MIFSTTRQLATQAKEGRRHTLTPQRKMTLKWTECDLRVRAQTVGRGGNRLPLYDAAAGDKRGPGGTVNCALKTLHRVVRISPKSVTGKGRTVTQNTDCGQPWAVPTPVTTRGRTEGATQRPSQGGPGVERRGRRESKERWNGK